MIAAIFLAILVTYIVLYLQ